jgi:hypothetical protein
VIRHGHFDALEGQVGALILHLGHGGVVEEGQEGSG